MAAAHTWTEDKTITGRKEGGTQTTIHTGTAGFLTVIQGVVALNAPLIP